MDITADSQRAVPRGSPPPSNVFLTGNFAPVLDELSTGPLEVLGSLPERLAGTYARVGPNPVYPHPGYVWFDGDGMVHAVHVENGTARYANRFVRTEGLARELAAEKSLYGGLLTGPPLKNTANTSLLWHHGKLLACYEGGLPHELGVPGLETRGQYDFGGRIPRRFTAHPKVDASTGELFFFWYDRTPPYVQYGIADRKGEITHLTPIDIPRPVMMHDVAITAGHVVFLDLPLVIEKGYEYRPELGARLGVLPRRASGSQIRWFPIEPCWVWHVLNAHEERDAIVLHGVRFARWLDGPGVLYRWRVDLTTGAVSEAALDDRSIEMPVLRPDRVGHAARYGVFSRISGNEHVGYLKYDLSRGTSQLVSHGKGRSGGEPFFVADPQGSDEDDGWILGFVHDETLGRSELVVHHAKDPGGEPLARVLMPRRVPYGIHGTWFAAGK